MERLILFELTFSPLSFQSRILRQVFRANTGFWNDSVCGSLDLLGSFSSAIGLVKRGPAIGRDSITVASFGTTTNYLKESLSDLECIIVVVRLNLKGRNITQLTKFYF